MMFFPVIFLIIPLESRLSFAVELSSKSFHEVGTCDGLSCISRGNQNLRTTKRSSFTSPKDSFETLFNQRNNERQILEVVEAELPPPTDVLDKLFSRVLFNTTMNYIVPLVKVTLPMHTDQGSTVHLAMQAFLGLFSAIAWVATIAVPVFLTQPNPFGIGTIGVRRSLPDFLQKFSFKWKLDSIINEETAKKIGIQWDPCLDRTICVAHRSPETYGWMAFPFLMFYPATNSNSTGNSALSAHHAKAAYYGAYSDEECEKLYHCFFDVLPLAKYLLYAWTH